jgi:hypothetical protein
MPVYERLKRGEIEAVQGRCVLAQNLPDLPLGNTLGSERRAQELTVITPSALFVRVVGAIHDFVYAGHGAISNLEYGEDRSTNPALAIPVFAR